MKTNWADDLTQDELNLLGLVTAEYLIANCNDGEYSARLFDPVVKEVAGTDLSGYQLRPDYDSYNWSMRNPAKPLVSMLAHHAKNVAVESSVDITPNDAFAMASVCHRDSNGIHLFDVPGQSHRNVALELYTTEFRSKTDSHGSIFQASSCVRIFELSMSPEQYVRLMRSDGADVPCTIYSCYGTRVGRLPDNMRKSTACNDEIIKHNVERVIEPLKIAVNAFISDFGGTPVSSKKKMEALKQRLADIGSTYQAVLKDILSIQEWATTDVVNYHVGEMRRRLDSEIMRIPTEHRDSVKNNLLSVLGDLQ